MFESVERALTALRRLASSYALLAVLDLRRAAVQLAWLVGSGVAIAVLVVTAWLAGVTALVTWMLRGGLSWPAALGVAAAVNLLCAAGLVWRMQDLLTEMPFAATLRQLRADETAAPPEEQP